MADADQDRNRTTRNSVTVTDPDITIPRKTYTLGFEVDALNKAKQVSRFAHKSTVRLNSDGTDRYFCAWRELATETNRSSGENRRNIRKTS